MIVHGNISDVTIGGHRFCPEPMTAKRVVRASTVTIPIDRSACALLDEIASERRMMRASATWNGHVTTFEAWTLKGLRRKARRWVHALRRAGARA